MMKKIFPLLTIVFTLALASCDKDQDLRSPEEKELDNIKATSDLLQYNLWGFNDLIIDVASEMRAIPLLANVADENGRVQPGVYNSFDIYGNDHRQEVYAYQFMNNKIYLDSVGQDEYQYSGSYLVLRANEIALAMDSLNPVRYTYEYVQDQGLFKMTSDNLANAGIHKAVNLMVAEAILSGEANDLASMVVDKLLANEEIQASIQQLLYDLIHGKVDEISQNPEDLAQALSELLVQKLKEVDWETLVYNKLVVLLEELKVDNPEEAAQELAGKIADRIETNFSQSDIYEIILPILENFENETLPKLVPALSEAIYGLIAEAFSEENIYNKIYPLWISFSEVDSSAVQEISDSLGTVVTEYFFDEETLASSLEPFINTLRTTPAYKIPALAQDIIDQVLIPLVDSLNASFPGLELDPDWNSIKTVLSSALTLLKSSIEDMTDEEAAASLAKSIIAVMDQLISKGFETAIHQLQDIPADQASQVLAAWISNLVEMAEPQIVAFLEEKLNALADMFDAEELAEELSGKIHDKIVEVFSVDNIYTILMPVMERLSEINVEEAARIITDWLFDLGLIEDNFTEEELIEALTGVIAELIGTINVDEATQKLVDLILQSEVVSSIDGKVLKQLLEFEIYVLLIDLGKDLNAIDSVVLSIIIK